MMLPFGMRNGAWPERVALAMYRCADGHVILSTAGGERTAMPMTPPLMTPPLAPVAQMSYAKGSFWRSDLCLLKLDLSKALGVLRCSGC